MPLSAPRLGAAGSFRGRFPLTRYSQVRLKSAWKCRPFAHSVLVLLLTRQQYISHSGLQAGAGTRRSAQARVVPLPSAGTQVRRLPEAPNPMIFKDRPWRAGPQTALPHLAVGWLQRRWGALLRTGTPRLNAIYIVAGLITRQQSISFGASGGYRNKTQRAGKRRSLSKVAPVHPCTRGIWTSCPAHWNAGPVPA